MTQLSFAAMMIAFLSAGLLHAQDTASVTYQPALGVYLIQYTVDSVSYSTILVPGTKINPVVKCSVGLQGPSGAFAYTYTVTLLPSSQQYLFSFAVTHLAPLQGAQMPNLGWMMMEIVGTSVWEWSNSLKDSTGLWTPVTDIAPGGSLGGFAFTSYGLPAIVNSFSSGNAPLLSLKTEAPDMLEPLLQPIITFPNNTVSQSTVGPISTPYPFRPLIFVDTLNSYVNRSRSFGWIANQATADKYTTYFNTARSQLQSANTSGALGTLQTVLTSANADSTSLLSSEAYALIRYNTQYLITQLQPSFQAKGGIFNPEATSILSVRAKPDSNFTSSDTLIALTATIRWQSRYSLTLGNVSSPIYGFTTYGSAVTVGSYKYQIFRTTTHVPLNWTAGSEYELFTVPVNGSAGVEDFELTNALSGGQWFVDIDYLDKTDSVFYQRVATCTGLAWQNKADNGGPTAYNGARHLAMTTTKLHEVYSSGGEIVYRRKSLTGSWEVTQRISSDSTGNNNDASIIVAHDGSLHVVWQQYLASTKYALLYNRSTDAGTTWGIPRRIPGLADSVMIVQDQWNIYPVIAEYGTSQLVVVCCYTGGLEYTKSTDLGQHWSSMQSTGAAWHGYCIWYPSLASLSSYNKLILTYDTRYYGVWSQTYTGSWSGEAQVNAGTGTNDDRYSSVAFDLDLGRLYAAWIAQPYYSEYGILFRIGGFNNSWGSQFVQFPVASGSGISDYYPSITGWDLSDAHNVDIIYNNSNNNVKLLQYFEGSGTWQSARVLSTSGYWTNTTLSAQSGGPSYPIRVWADQSANPYQVTLHTDGSYNLQKPQSPATSPAELHRRIVIEGKTTGSTIWFDLAPLKVVTATNDTLVVPFKKLKFNQPLVATIQNAWDYLGTDTVSVPSNARSLIIETDISSRARQDTLGKTGTNVFTTSTFRFDGVKASQTIPLLSNQPGMPGRRVIDITQQAGQAITFRMVGTVPAASSEPILIGVGDVYITRKP